MVTIQVLGRQLTDFFRFLSGDMIMSWLIIPVGVFNYWIRA
jgi:hypothetical protein